MTDSLEETQPYPEGTPVRVESEALTLNGKTGKIRGLQSNYAVVGYIYVVDFGEVVGSEYPYSCVCLPQGCLRPLGVTRDKVTAETITEKQIRVLFACGEINADTAHLALNETVWPQERHAARVYCAEAYRKWLAKNS